MNEIFQSYEKHIFKAINQEVLTYSTFTLVHRGWDFSFELLKCLVYLKGFSFLFFSC